LGVKYVVGDYNHDDWRETVKGLETEPERGARCSKCFAYRFCYAKKYAMEHGFNAIASVFGVSRHKDQSQVDNSAIESCGDIKYLPIKWNEQLRQQINRESDFYRQNYCGCEYSIRK
jgi:predicted adenine nucleotide alpha hydrolase (AANH) superfamily ATPase